MAMAAITAGLGDVPQGLAYDLALNTSRILAIGDCPYKAKVYYKDRVALAGGEQSTALTLGTAWHKAMELLWSKPAQEVAAEISGEVADGPDSEWADWFSRAILAYHNRYGCEPPTGKTLATEVPFWIHIPEDRLLLRGRLDRVCHSPGRGLVNGEIKTFGDRADLADYLAERRGHIQDRIYHLALTLAPKPAEWPQEPVWGTIYDITRKSPWPKVKSKNGTVEERRALWPSSLFFTEAIRRTDEAPGDVLAEVRAFARLWREGPITKNRHACHRFQRKCAYWQHCWDDEPLDSYRYTEREADYCD